MNVARDHSKAGPEFKAVILAGTGTNLAPLTRNYQRSHSIDEPVPKALLPIGNKPMLNFPFAWIEAAGVTDVLLICPASHRPRILHFVHSENTSFPSLKINIVTLDDDDEGLGTADALRTFAGGIQTDFVVLPCDFIPPPSLSLSTLLNAHRMDPEGPLLTALLYERGEKARDGPIPFLVVVNEKSNTLLHIPYEETDDDVSLRMSLMYKSSKVRLTSRYLDSHVYVLKRTVLDLLAERTDISSIREELIPWLCRIQYRTALQRRWGGILSPTETPQRLALQHSTLRSSGSSKTDMHFGLMSPTSAATSAPPSRPPSPRSAKKQAGGDLDWSDYPPVNLRCGYVAHKLEDGQALRANTLKSYFEANRMALKEGSYVSSHQQSTPSPLGEYMIDPKAQISSDSLIGSSTRVGERTSIKKSIIGSHCLIGKNVKISGCVIMDHAVIKDGCKIDNSILSRHVIVEEKCSLKDCETATGVALAAGGDHKGERFEQFEYDE